MLKKRIIPAIDVLDDKAVKYVKFRTPTIVGDPATLGKLYAESGADELIYLDTTASLKEEEIKYDWIRRVADEVFIPFTVIGGIRSVEDIRKVLLSGADKVGINTAAVQNPQLIKEASQMFGSQCIVLGLDVKKNYDSTEGKSRWEVFTHSAHKSTGIDAIEWAQQASELGAGEIVCTCIDRDGTKDGYDLQLMHTLSQAVKIPVIASGGAGDLSHIFDVFKEGKADAALVASILHYNLYTISDIKSYLSKKGIDIRKTY